jgi:hypothetical protein
MRTSLWPVAFAVFLLALMPIALTAQQADLPLHDDAYHLLDRLDVKGALAVPLSSETKPYGREHVAGLLDTALIAANLRLKDQAWIARVRFRVDDDVRASDAYRGVLKSFWKNRRDIYHYRQPGFSIYVNPLLYFAGGRDEHGFTGTESPVTTYRNTRGLQIRGSLFGKVGFLTEVSDNQARFPQFINQGIRASSAVPGEGFWKPFKTTSYDYANFRGYLTYSPIKALRIKFGRDRAFWGQGSQSLLLSDYATDYLLLSLNTRIWKLEYTNQFMEMVDFIPNKPDAVGTYPRKYGAFHLLTYRPTKQVSVSLFESTVFAPDLANGTRGFELQYLNPLIFYRTVEQYIGSPDNSLFGLMYKWNFLQRFQLYGQAVVDDYNFGERKNGSGWWGNKVGLQGGAKYIDVLGIETLDLQLEYNLIRPYVYSHFNLSSNYSHYGQFLSHSLGANLHDLNLALNYQPIPGLYLYARYGYIRKGLDDAAGGNYGGNIFRAGGPVSFFDNTVAQGTELILHTVQARASWQFWQQNLYVDLEGLYRKANDITETQAISVALRYNLPWRPINW